MAYRDLDIPRLRLSNQRITGSKFTKPDEVVRWLGAVQAQDYFGAQWSLGLRLQHAVDEDIDRAFASGSILRTHVLRPTWHFVTPADIRWLLALSAPRVHAVNASMYRNLGLNGAILDKSSDVLAGALRGGHQLTRLELGDVLHQAGIEQANGLRLTYIMMHAELEGLICSGARRGKQFTYALLEERAPGAWRLGREQAIAELAGRYFNSRGPATLQDFAKWSGLTVADARRGLEAVRANLRQEVIDDRTFWLPASQPPPVEVAPAAHLLSIYDEYISGYKDRSDIGTQEISARLVAMGNALTSIILLDGRIAGTWKRSLRRRAVLVETNPFSDLTAAEKQTVAQAALRYGDFLQLPVELTAR